MMILFKYRFFLTVLFPEPAGPTTLEGGKNGGEWVKDKLTRWLLRLLLDLQCALIQVEDSILRPHSPKVLLYASVQSVVACVHEVSEDSLTILLEFERYEMRTWRVASCPHLRLSWNDARWFIWNLWTYLWHLQLPWVVMNGHSTSIQPNFFDSCEGWKRKG